LEEAEVFKIYALTRYLAATALIAGLCACEQELYDGLSQKEANEIVASLAEEGIAASKAQVDEKGWQVRVDEADTAVALDVLRYRGLPHERFANLGEMFQKQGLVATPAEERMRYIHAVSQELSGTLVNIDGVIAANVHVVIPANDPLSDKIRPSSAAVFIKYSQDVDVRTLAPMVKDLVSHSIEGLSRDNVSLSLSEARQPRRDDKRHARSTLKTAMGGASVPPSIMWFGFGLLLCGPVIGVALVGLRRGKLRSLMAEMLTPSKRTKPARPAGK
jgi:type III secretion protein J